MFVSYLYNTDFLVVGACMAAIGLLGFVIVLNNPRSSTHRAFFLFSLLTIAYGMTNFLNHQVDSPILVLWYLRLTIFFGVWHAFSLLHLVTIFPYDIRVYTPMYKYVLVPITILISLLTLTPLVLDDVGSAVAGEVSNPTRGPFIPLFGGLVLYLVGKSVVVLIQKTRRARGIQRKQLLYVSVGTFMTFFCILFFNVLFPLVFHIVRFVPLAPVYFLPFVGFTGYAIIRHRLLNVKVIATEIFSFVLAIILLTEVDFALDVRAILFRLGSFALFIVFSYYLIQSVHREVESRAQIEKLAGELRKTNTELSRVNQAKSDFLSMASHQLKTPLSIIKGYLSMVLEGSFGTVESTVHTQLNKVYISNERLISLVEDLLNFSRLEEGRMQYDKEPVDLREIISSVSEELKDSINRKHLALQMALSSEALPVFVDKLKMRNVVFNLVDNAIKYTDQGSITITARKKELGAVVEVADTGKGMNKADLGKIFQKFQRGEAEKGNGSRRTTAAGFGLGLYVAWVMVKDHEGTIVASSDGPGKGSVFRLTLPLHTPRKSAEKSVPEEK